MLAHQYTESEINDFNDEFLTAAIEGNLEKLKTLHQDKSKKINVNRASDLNKKYVEKITPLYMAALKGHLEVVNYLLTIEGINVNWTRASNGYSALYAAIESSIEIVKLLLNEQYQVNVNHPAEGCYTALHLAAATNKPAAISFLLAAKADPNIKYNDSTPLDYAISRGNYDCGLLLDGCEQNIHGCIIQRLKALGFISNPSGVCYGFAQVAKLCALAGKESYEHFCQTIFTLKRLSVAELLKLQNAHNQYIEQAVVDALNELNLEKGLLTETQQREVSKLTSLKLAEIRKNLNKEQQANEKKYLDILSLFNGIELEHQGESYYTHLTDKRIYTQTDNPSWVSPLIQPIALEKKGGEAVLADFYGAYTATELSVYFKKLRTRLKDFQTVTEPIILTLSSCGHTLDVKYNLSEDTWEIIDVNNFPSSAEEYQAYIFPGETDISKIIAEYFFSTDGTSLFQTTASITKNVEHFIKPAINQWQNDIRFLHTITPEKAKIVDSSGANLLYFAAQQDDIENIKKLLPLTNNVKTKPSVQSAFSIASHHGHLKAAELLLNHPDTLLNKKYYKGGVTPLHIAVAVHQPEIVKLLLDAETLKKKFDPNIKSNSGDSPLLLAAKNGYTDSIEHLLKMKKINIDQTDEDGNTALMLAALNMHLDTVKAILKEKSLEINPNIKNKHGETALFYAVASKNLEMVKALLEANFKSAIDMNIKTNDHSTVFYYAAQEEYFDIMDALFQAGADVNISYNSYTPVYHAVLYGYKKILEKLIAYSADINIPDKNGNTPLKVAVENNNVAIVKLLLDTKANVNRLNSARMGAIHVAAQTGAAEIMKLLLDPQYKLIVDLKGDQNYTAASLATRHGHVEILEMLANRGANLEHECDDGTPLMLAAKRNRLEVITCLLKRNVNPLQKDKYQHTALYYAILYLNFEAANRLLEVISPDNLSEEDYNLVARHPTRLLPFAEKFLLTRFTKPIERFSQENGTLARHSFFIEGSGTNTKCSQENKADNLSQTALQQTLSF